MRKLLITSGLGALMTISASADTINPGSSTFQAMGNFAPFTGTSGVQGNPFWNNFSLDGSQMNAGYFLTGTGGFTGGNIFLGTAAPVYLGATSGSPNQALAFNFVRSASTIAVTTLYTNAMSNVGAQGNVVGVYNVADPNQKTPFFAPGTFGNPSGGPQGVYNINAGTTPSLGSFVSPYANYGFYAVICVNPSGVFCRTYYSDSALNSDDAGHQHLAVFRDNTNPSVFYIAIESAFGTNTTAEVYGDYNDIILRIATSDVPEPATLSIVGLGLIGIAAVRRRFQS